jgi:hypothetical protein
VPAEVDVGGGEIAEAFVVAAVVVAFDEGANAGFEIARQEPSGDPSPPDAPPARGSCRRARGQGEQPARHPAVALLAGQAAQRLGRDVAADRDWCAHRSTSPASPRS